MKLTIRIKHPLTRILGPHTTSFFYQAIEVDKMIENRIEYAYPVALQFSTHRMLPRKHFVLVAEDVTDRSLGAPIELENGLETLFVDHNATAQITDRLRSYASHLQEVDRSNPGRRQQPYEGTPPGASECISATLEENLQIVSYRDLGIEVLSMARRLPQSRNCIIEAIGLLVQNYEEWYEAQGREIIEAWDAVVHHVAYTLQHPPAFLWYIHPTEAMITGRNISFYHLASAEGLRVEEDGLQFLQVPGIVPDVIHASCTRARQEMEIIADAYIFAPECTRIQVIVGDIQQ
jgi:hypothetical protein